MKSRRKSLFPYIILYFAILFSITFLLPNLLFLLLDEEILNKYAIPLSAIIQILSFFVVGKMILRKKNAELPVKKMQALKALPKSLGVTVFVFVISRLLIDGIKWIYIGAMNDLELIEITEGMELYPFIVALFFLAAVPAVCEEIYYRVAVYHILADYKPSTIILVSTLFFSLSHIAAGWESMLSALLLGYILIAAFIKTANYLSLCITHFIFNALMLFFSHRIFFITDPYNILDLSSSATETIFWGLIFIAIALVLLAFAAAFSGIDKKKNEV